MRKTIALIIGFICLFSTSLQAQKEIVNGVVIDKEAKTILNKAAQKIANYKSLQITFTTTTENKADKTTITNKGTLLVKDEKYQMKMDNQIMYCDGKTIWHYLPNEKEVQIHDFKPENTESINLTKLLSEYEKNYRPKLIREEKKGNAISQILDLIPIKSTEYFKVRLFINKESSQITQMDFQLKKGGTISYKIENYKPNIQVTDSEFVFDTTTKNDVEVIDMR